MGHTLWVVGGDFFDAQSTNVALPLVQNLYFPPFNLALPYVEGGSGEAPDDTFAQARVLAATGPRQFNFNDQEDLYDFFIFYLPEGRAVTVSLSKIGDGNNYDLALYEGDKKELLDFSDNIGDLDETIHINLFPSIYYVVVERISPDVDPGDFYQIEIEW